MRVHPFPALKLLVLCLLVIPACFTSLSLTAQTAEAEKVQYAKRTFSIRVVDDWAARCRQDGIDDESLNHLLNELGAQRLSRLFPNHAPLASKRSVSLAQLPDISLIYRVWVPEGTDIRNACARVRKHPAIKFAEPDYIDSIQFYQPNDPILADPGQFWPDQIQAYDAWSITKGDTNVVIGIVDTGFDLDHPDLAAALYVNRADPVNGVDDDRDGYLDNYSGWDFGGATVNGPVPDGDPSVRGGDLHGSKVSGVACARSDNGIGTASPGFQAKYLAVKANADDGGSAVEYGYEGILYAAEKGCKVINCSWGGAIRSEIRQEMIDYVVRRYGTLIVAAAGNRNNQTMLYPASYENVLSVAAVDHEDRKSVQSSFNFQVDVASPATWVRYPVYDDRYESDNQGYTSIATPIVSSSAALLQAYFPDWTGQQLGEQLRVTADNIEALNPTIPRGMLGRGRINLRRALTERGPSVRLTAKRTFDSNDNLPAAGETVELEATLKSFLEPLNSLSLTLSTDSEWLRVERATIQTGAFGTLEERAVEQRFVLVIAEGTPPNTEVWLRLDFEDGDYRDFQYFSLLLNATFIDFEVNRIATSLNSVGNFGYNNPGANRLGLGFRHDGGSSWLYDGGIIVAESPNRVYDNIRTTMDNLNSDDFAVDSTVRMREPRAGAAGYATARYTEKATGQRRLSVWQEAFAWDAQAADQSVLLIYHLQNRTGEDMDSVYFGVFADWDVGSSNPEWSANSCRYDSENRLNYTYLNQNHVGAAVLGSDQAHVHNYGFSSNFIFTDANKFLAISGGVQEPEWNQDDVRGFISVGPVALPAGETRRVAVALGAATSLLELQGNVRELQRRYECLYPSSAAELEVELPESPQLMSLAKGIENCRPYEEILVPLHARNLAADQSAGVVADASGFPLLAANGSFRVVSSNLTFNAANGFRDTLRVHWYDDASVRSSFRLDLRFAPVGQSDPLRLSCEDRAYSITLADTNRGWQLLSGPASLCAGREATLTAPACPDCRYEWFRDGVFEGRSFQNYWQARKPGRWTVRILNRSGCQLESAPSVVVQNSGPVILSLEALGRPCRANQPAEVRLNVEGGRPPYRYSFQGGGWQDAPTYSVRSGETLSARVQDAGGCVDEIEERVEFSPFQDLKISRLFVGRSGCRECARGFIVVHVEGGQGPYRYFLNDEERTRAELIGLRSGDWTLRIEDANGCAVERVVVIRE